MKKLILEKLSSDKNKFLLLLCCLSQATLQASSPSESSRSSDLEAQLEEAMASPKEMGAALVGVVESYPSPEEFREAYGYLSSCQKQAKKLRRKSIDKDDEKLQRKANRRLSVASKAQDCLTTAFKGQQQLLLGDVRERMVGLRHAFNRSFSPAEIAVMDRVLQNFRANRFQVSPHLPTILLSPDVANASLKEAMEAKTETNGLALLDRMLEGDEVGDPYALPVIITEEMLDYAYKLNIDLARAGRMSSVGIPDDGFPLHPVSKRLRDLYIQQQFAKASEIIRILNKELKKSAHLMECAYALQALRAVFLVEASPVYRF